MIFLVFAYYGIWYPSLFILDQYSNTNGSIKNTYTDGLVIKILSH